MCGLHRTVFSHTPGPCTILEGIAGGSEDIVTLPDGLAFITSVSVHYTWMFHQSCQKFQMELDRPHCLDPGTQHYFIVPHLCRFTSKFCSVTVLCVISHHSRYICTCTQLHAANGCIATPSTPNCNVN